MHTACGWWDPFATDVRSDNPAHQLDGNDSWDMFSEEEHLGCTGISETVLAKAFCCAGMKNRRRWVGWYMRLLFSVDTELPHRPCPKARVKNPSR
ncbi:hypothetical protein ACLOJK_029015 [Asimina triloba]